MLSSPTARRRSQALLLLVGLLASVLMVVAQSGPSTAASTGKVRGSIIGKHGDIPKVKMLYFDADWTYIGQRKVYSGAYSLSLKPGTYHLQFVDQRPAYDVKKYAPTDVKVTVKLYPSTIKNVRMKSGAAITGTAKAGGKPAKGARIVAANTNEQSFSVTANDKGQFALGGLPDGNYSVFTYDKSRTWVGKSAYVAKLKHGQAQNISIRLNKRGGGLLVDLYAGSEPIGGKVSVTAVSKRTGQFWTTTSKHGTAIFQGLYPGKYKLVMPGVGNYMGRTGNVDNGNVHPKRTAFGSFRLTERGASLGGRLITGDNAQDPIANATVRLYDKTGALVGSSSTNSDGAFFIGGQLRSMTGLTLVAFNSYAMQYFGTLKVPGLALKTGQYTALGTLKLPRIATPTPTASTTAPTATPTTTSPTASPTTTSPTATPTTTSPTTTPSATSTAPSPSSTATATVTVTVTRTP